MQKHIHIVESEHQPADDGTVEYCFALHNKFGQLAVHMYTPHNDGYHNGDYFGSNLRAALDRYEQRCLQHGLKANVAASTRS